VTNVTDRDIAVVTGAGRGIGRGIALRLAADGFAVAVADIIDDAEQVAKEITAAGGVARAFTIDITSDESVAAGRALIHDTLGVPSVLVNNAGWQEHHYFKDTDSAFWNKIVDINYVGTLRMSHAFLGDLAAAGNKGRIINISSDAGRVGSMRETPYAGAKGAIIAFTKSLARETARDLTTVNCVCPGPTDTPLLRLAPEASITALIRAVPFRRLAEPADIANAVAFFAAPAAHYVTGQVLSVSGGLTMAG
jgi:2-hydroxycyclohexanecarboxyl-CoA dehydrogenase